MVENDKVVTCFFEMYGKDFGGYYRDNRIQSLMTKAASSYRNSFTKDELESVKLQWLWNAIRKFDSEKFPNTKFTSYLFNQVVFGLKIELKKRQRDKFRSMGSFDSGEGKFGDPKRDYATSESPRVAKDFIMDLPSDVKFILEQKYLYNMTMQEIGEANGYSRETARRRINSAVQFCRKLQ
jgi:RNA polymerase sigma factor (sigma-70 family)|tara:strand:- start:118 stop:660 length:543 start_codon:yes stop_codon:yes gene_type:complete